MCHGVDVVRYDGRWWARASVEEQIGFESGASDCASAELRRQDSHSRSAQEECEFVTKYYLESPGKSSVLVLDVLAIAGTQVLSDKGPTGGESWTEPHGFWDGQWWREGTAAERLGFVEGYLACYARSEMTQGKFGKAPGRYTQLINNWYGLNEKTGDVDPSRVDIKIADVLLKFRDNARAPQ